MKKFCLCVMILLYLTACTNNTIYETGKDTVYSFGDGLYQILHQKVNNKEEKLLTNCKYNQCVLTEISNYKIVENTVYFIGKYYDRNVYCRLNVVDNLLKYYIEGREEFTMVFFQDMYEDGQIEILTTYEDFTENDRGVFKSLID